MVSLFDSAPVEAPHKTNRFWKLVGLVAIAVLFGSVIGHMYGFSFRVQIKSGIITLATGISAFWCGVRFGRPAWLILAFLVAGFTLWAVFYTWLFPH